MIRLGERQELVIVKTVDFGVYLAVPGEEDQERVLLGLLSRFRREVLWETGWRFLSTGIPRTA